MIEVFGFYKFMSVNQLNKQKVLLNDFLVNFFGEDFGGVRGIWDPLMFFFVFQ